MSRENASDELARSCSEDSAAYHVEPIITSCTDSDDESLRIGQSTGAAAAAARLDISDERAVDDVTTFAGGSSQEQTSEELGESESTNALPTNYVVPRFASVLIETPSGSKTPPAPQPLSTLHRELVRSKRIQEAPVPPSLVKTTTTPPQPGRVVTTSSHSGGAASTTTPIDHAQQYPELAQSRQIRDASVQQPPVGTSPTPTLATPPSSSEQTFLNYYPSSSTSGTPFVDAVPINVNSLNQERSNEHDESPQLADHDEEKWRKRWKRYLLAAVIAVVVIAAAVAIPVALTSKNDEPAPAPNIRSNSIESFRTTADLLNAVDAYLENNGRDTAVAQRYGWPIDEWRVERISNFVQLFSAERNPRAALFDEPLRSWNVSRATKMREMFHSALMFNQDVSMWEVAQVTDMTEMFRGASSFSQNLCPWQSILDSGTVQVQGMFSGTSCAFDKDPTLTASSDAPGGHFCTLCPKQGPQDPPSPPPTHPSTKLTPTEAPSPSQSPSATQDPTPAQTQSPTPSQTREPAKCFQTKDELRDAVDRYLENSSDMTSMAYEYGWPINKWCVSQVTDFSALFSAKRNNATANFNERLDLWDVSNAVNMEQMFRECAQFNQDLNAWNTSVVTDMSHQFRAATSFNGRVSSWDTSNVKNMGGMFMNAKSFSQDTSQWDVSGVNNMQDMFAKARKFAGNLAAWNVSSVKDMSRLFHGCSSFNSDLSAWDVRMVGRMNQMFRYARNFQRNLCSWGPRLQGRNAPVSMTNMFANSGCPTKATPNLTSSPPGPFCFVCE